MNIMIANYNPSTKRLGMPTKAKPKEFNIELNA